MAFFNAVVRDYNPESGNSEILCRVWICSLADFKSVPKSWFLRYNGRLLKKGEVDKRLMAKFTLLTPVHIYTRPRTRKQFPILVNLEFFGGGAKMKGVKGITVDVEEGDSVEVVKWKVENGSGIPSSQQRLIYAGAQLKERRTVREYGIRMEEVIHVVDGVRRGVDDGGGDREEEEEEEGKFCVVCDRRRVGMDEFVVDCGHYYHACCLPPIPGEGEEDGKGCVVCNAELLSWSEALGLFAEEEEVEMATQVRSRSRLLEAPQLVRDEEEEDDEGIEVDFAAADAMQYFRGEEGEDGIMGRLRKWKEYDEFYYLIAAILIPMLVGTSMGNFWGVLAAVGMIELLRRKHSANNDRDNNME